MVFVSNICFQESLSFLLKKYSRYSSRYYRECEATTEAFIVLVVLINYLNIPAWGDDARSGDLHLVELFAGVGRIAKLASWLGLNARAYDIAYTPIWKPKKKRGQLRRSPMDLNGAAGFTFLRYYGTCFPFTMVFCGLLYYKAPECLVGDFVIEILWCWG